MHFCNAELYHLLLRLTTIILNKNAAEMTGLRLRSASVDVKRYTGCKRTGGILYGIEIYADSGKQGLFQALAGRGKLSMDFPAAQTAYRRAPHQCQRELYPVCKRGATLLDAGLFL